MCHGYLAALDLQDKTFHEPQQVTDDVDFGVGQLRALDLGLGGSWADHLTCSPLPIPPGLALQHCPQ